MREGVVAHGVRAEEIDPQHIHHFFGSHFFKGSVGWVNSRVVDDAIDAAVGGDRPIDGGSDLIL